MTFLRDMMEDLRSKPVLLFAAIALLVVLVAVILFLGKPVKEPTATAPPPPPANTPANGDVANISQTPLAVSEGKPFNEQDTKSVRIFARKNPFRSRIPFVPAASQTAATAGTGTTDGGSTDTTSTGGADTGSGTDGGGTTVSYYKWIAKVRFGKKDDQLKHKTLDGLESLPSSNNPVLVFLGITNGDTAVFLVSSSALATGEGNCQPSEAECTFLYMKDGNTETIEATSTDDSVTSYELKVDDIKIKKTSSPSAAAAKAAAVKAGVAAPPAAPKPSTATATTGHQRQVERRKERRKTKRQIQRVSGVLRGLGSY